MISNINLNKINEEFIDRSQWMRKIHNFMYLYGRCWIRKSNYRHWFGVKFSIPFMKSFVYIAVDCSPIP